MELILVIASFAMLAGLAGIVYPFRPFGKRRNALVTVIGSIVAAGIAAPAQQSAGTTSLADAIEQSLQEADKGETQLPANVSPKGERLNIPSDASANYFVTGIGNRTDGMVEISTRREGPSGTSFVIRLVQCDPLRFGYIAEADTEDRLVRDPAPQLTELVAGSISDVVARHACEKRVSPDQIAATEKPVAQKSDQSTEELKAAKRAEIEGEVRSSVERLLWTDARNRFRALGFADLVTEDFKAEIESRMLELVRPLPASERESNLRGYQFLAAVRPEKPEYAAKVESYKEAIKTERQRAVTRLRKSEDRVEGITWYQHPNAPKYLNSRSTAYLYIGKKGEAGRPWLRMKVQFTASTWLFVKNVSAWHDGIKEPLISGYFERDNNTTIWEWMDVMPDDYQIEVLRSLANADEAILRFQGDQYRKDVTLSAGDKKAIREVLEAYEVMRSGM